MVNETQEDKKSTIGARNYALLRDLMALAKLKNQSFAALSEALKKHF